MNGNVKKFASKRISIVLAVMIIATLFVTPVCATVNGSLTFVHGVNTSQKITYGKIKSTAVENSMSINGHIYFMSGPNSGSYAYYESTVFSNISSLTRSISPGSIKGKSSFQYYVDGSLQHTTTEWWAFDFR